MTIGIKYACAAAGLPRSNHFRSFRSLLSLPISIIGRHAGRHVKNVRIRNIVRRRRVVLLDLDVLLNATKRKIQMSPLTTVFEFAASSVKRANAHVEEGRRFFNGNCRRSFKVLS